MIVKCVKCGGRTYTTRKPSTDFPKDIVVWNKCVDCGVTNGGKCGPE